MSDDDFTGHSDDESGYVDVETFAEPEVSADPPPPEEKARFSMDDLRMMDGKGSDAPKLHDKNAKGQGKANTGPKGVMQDYKDAQLRMRARRLEQKMATERAISRMAVGEERFVVAATPAARPDSDESDDDWANEDDDDETLARFKAERWATLQQTQQAARCVSVC
jgi:hypothetical protein